MIDYKIYIKVFLFSPLIFLACYLIFTLLLFISDILSNNDIFIDIAMFSIGLLLFSTILFEVLQHGIHLLFESTNDSIVDTIEVFKVKDLYFVKKLSIKDDIVHFRHLYSSKGKLLCGLINLPVETGKYKITYLPKSKIILELEELN